MVKKVEIENFKCFSEKTTIPLSNITVCTGINSVGKSTLIQALLLMHQSEKSLKKFLKEDSVLKILLNTDALNLGSTNQVMITDEMFLSVDENWIKYVAGEDKLSLIIKEMGCAKKIIPINTKDMEAVSILACECYYLNAERLGPRNYQGIKSHDVLHCGYHGEYTFDVIGKNPFAEIAESRRFKLDPEKTISEFNKQIDYWMGYIVHGVEVKFSSDLTTTQLSQMTVRQAALDTPFNSPHNFGFGISYVLPIIATGLIANKKSMIIIENPEAHLHPTGQSRIGEFLAQISCADIQVVIETHSEHVINGIRKFALKNNMLPSDISINYFSLNSETHKHEVNRLLLNERMDILTWPEGFFDQEAKDLKALRELRSSKK